jgi:hypothetical protein
LNLDTERNHSFARRYLGKGVWLLLWIVVTLFGFQVARWTRSGAIANPVLPFWLINLSAHLVVLGLWTLSWLLVWKHVLARRGGPMLALGAALLAAAAAEIIQAWLPGHIPDLIGFVYNLVAVTATYLLFWNRWLNGIENK